MNIFMKTGLIMLLVLTWESAQADKLADLQAEMDELTEYVMDLAQQAIDLGEDITALKRENAALKKYQQQSAPVGSIYTFAATTIPEGFLFCDGKAYDKTAYPELFTVIGYTYGGKGAKFNVPDYRKMFLRGMDKLRQGRKLASVQQDATAMPNIPFTSHSAGEHAHSMAGAGNHSHSTSSHGAGNHYHNVTGTTNKKGSHDHRYDDRYPTDGFQKNSGVWHDHNVYTRTSDKARTTGSAGSHAHSFNVNTNSRGSHSHKVDLKSADNHVHTINQNGKHTHAIAGGDAETRPINQAVVYIIKAFP
ncbi:MAG: phage tail protein [Candidatus Parabeggiatoa sp.]|nr:phage tail protein [Candidatus Parabeggiatoa sp.]